MDIVCYYTEPCRVVLIKTRRARKDHVCSECRKPIVRSDSYLYVHGIDYEGIPFDHKECRWCQEDRNRIIEDELKSGCDSREADPGYGGLIDAMLDRGMISCRERADG